MSIKEGYYYSFYKLYRFYERGPSVWLSDWKASFFLVSIGNMALFICFELQVSFDEERKRGGCVVLQQKNLLNGINVLIGESGMIGEEKPTDC